MRRRKRRQPLSFAGMLLELTQASWETIGHRTLMIARGTCSPGEYRRMVQEKTEALNGSVRRMRRKRMPGAASVLAPWHAKATANARRLRRRAR